MTNYKEIIRLHSLGLNKTRIAESCGCARSTVITALHKAEENGLFWNAVKNLSSEEVARKLYPATSMGQQYSMPDYEWVHKEMQKSGVTLSLLWVEYCERCRQNGELPYKSTQFNKYYADYVHKTKATMHLEHKPGENLQVDWAGQTAGITDTDTGDRLPAYLFVAVLPYSGYAYNDLPVFMQQQIDDIRLIQERYAWFLDGVFADAVFEKKKGQKKIPLAPMICSRGYEAFISGVSLGENPETDAPPVKTQYRIRGEKEKAEIVEKMYFDRLLDFVYVEFMKGLQKGFVPKRCANCGRWFLQTPGATFAYCAGSAPGQDGKTCREIGASSSFRSKVENNDVWKVHQRAYKKYFARIRSGLMTKGEFEVWSRQAADLQDAALERYARAENEEERQRIAQEIAEALNAE